MPGKGKLGSWAALGKGTASLQAPSPVLGPQRSQPTRSPTILAVSPAGPFRRKPQASGESRLARSLSPTSNFPGPFSALVETICPGEDPAYTRHSGESGGGNTLTGLSCFLWRLNLHLGGPHCPDELREAQVGAIAPSSSPRTRWTQGWNFLGVLQGLSAESSVPSSLPASGPVSSPRR